jgi:hypothetical protein
MSETLPMKIAVGDAVRVHFHPPGPWKSFSEGVVRRADVTTPEGRFFVLEVRNEVLLDQPHRIKPNFHDYVRYEGRNDFPGRIEVLATEQDGEREPAPAPISVEALEGSVRASDEQPLSELALHPEVEAERMSETETVSAPSQVDVELPPVRKQGGLLATLLGRRE